MEGAERRRSCKNYATGLLLFGTAVFLYRNMGLDVAHFPQANCASNDTILKQAKLIALLEREIGEKTKENEQLRLACQLTAAAPGVVPSQNVKPTFRGSNVLRRNATAHSAAAPERSNPSPVVGVLVFTYNRPQYLNRSLSQFLSVIRSRPDSSRFPVTVSQDGADAGVAHMLDNVRAQLHDVFHHPQYQRKGGESATTVTYTRISQHYLSSLTKMFAKYDQVIVLEDDLTISVDLFDYFSAFLPALQSDPTLLCVSAWNDNGFPDVVADYKMAYRTDVFPGLGWMITKKVFDSIKDKWPKAYWDEYMRDPNVSQGRQCIRPEVNRAITFGREGSSHGEFYDSHLSRMVLNMKNIDWVRNEDYIDLVRTQSNFDTYIKSMLAKATVVKLAEVDTYAKSGAILRIYYDDVSYGTVASKFNIMKDKKHGMRRTSYRHVIIIRWHSSHIFLTQKWPE